MFRVKTLILIGARIGTSGAALLFLKIVKNYFTKKSFLNLFLRVYKKYFLLLTLF